MAPHIGTAWRRAACSVPLAALLLATPAHAMSIVFTYDTADGTFGSLAPATQAAIQSALNTVATQYDTAFSNNITVNIQIAWGTVTAGQAIPAGDIAYAIPQVQNSTYGAVKTYLSSFGGVLPASNPTTALNTYLPTAEAKALGAFSGSAGAIDGYVGFSSLVGWSYTDTSGVALNTYDFLGVAKQEIGHVLGRISGLTQANPIGAYPFDFFRYSAKGITTFTYKAAAYASIDGGKTSLGNLDTSGTDSSDWLNAINCATVARSVVLDAETATFCTGNVATFSPQDLTMFSALGYVMSGNTGGLDSTALTPNGATLVPEPASLAVLALGGTMLGLLRRRVPPQA